MKHIKNTVAFFDLYDNVTPLIYKNNILSFLFLLSFYFISNMKHIKNTVAFFDLYDNVTPLIYKNNILFYVMIVRLIWYFLPISIALNYIFAIRTKREKIYNKNILIIGGSSGLGYSFAKIFSLSLNRVWATSRDDTLIREMNRSSFINFFHCDVFDTDTFEKETTEYDIIFYCTGLSLPGYFTKKSVKEFELCANTNYLGMIKILKHYTKINKKPFDFVMIGSILTVFPLQGYSTYCPSKSAMLSFFYSTYEELKMMNIKLHFFSPSNMQTHGFEIENTMKPFFTKAVEKFSHVYDPDECAFYFINKFKDRKVITIDLFTYFCQIRFECEKLVDYLLFPVAVAVVFVAKLFVRYLYKYFK
jgi:3-dehydrosphinganine reductase